MTSVGSEGIADVRMIFCCRKARCVVFAKCRDSFSVSGLASAIWASSRTVALSLHKSEASPCIRAGCPQAVVDFDAARREALLVAKRLSSDCCGVECIVG